MNFPPTIVAHFMPQQYTAHSTLKTTKQSVLGGTKKDCGVYACMWRVCKVYIDMLHVYAMHMCCVVRSVLGRYAVCSLCKAPSDGCAFLLGFS